MYIPDCEEFIKGCREFDRNEGHHPMYKVATKIILMSWGDPQEMADGLSILLLTWNQAFYRYGDFDFEKLKGYVSDYLLEINSFRDREIYTLSEKDENKIIDIFVGFLEALQINKGVSQGKKSPVAVAKALHL